MQSNERERTAHVRVYTTTTRRQAKTNEQIKKASRLGGMTQGKKRARRALMQQHFNNLLYITIQQTAPKRLVDAKTKHGSIAET